ncbi:GNAT family N-acetyltransferase [Rhizobium sp. RAF56]|jgi:CelD/BcsL family acetyltransferase involved in cellulose biosynthesis
MQQSDILTPAADRAEASARHHLPLGSLSSAASDDLRVECFDTMAPLETEWRALERDDLASLHQSYDWCAAWVAAHGRPLAILHGTLCARSAFILPIEIIRRPMLMRAEFIGAAHSNINTGLFSREFTASAGDMPLQSRLADALRGKADLLVLRNVPFAWRGQASPLAALPAVETHNRAFQLPLLGSMEETLAQVNAKRRRKKYRQQTRVLEEAGGYEHVIPTSAEEQRAMLDLFFRQKSERFRAAGLPDVFRTAEIRDFLHRLLDCRNETHPYEALELHGLRLKGRHEGDIAAVAALSRKGDHVICQLASIDESLYPEASPGELLFWLMIERAEQQGARLFDLGIGDQRYKRSWCPVETVQHDVILPISAIGRAAATAARGATYAKAALKANPRLYRLLQRLRAAGGQKSAATQGDTD